MMIITIIIIAIHFLNRKIFRRA